MGLGPHLLEVGRGCGQGSGEGVVQKSVCCRFLTSRTMFRVPGAARDLPKRLGDTRSSLWHPLLSRSEPRAPMLARLSEGLLGRPFPGDPLREPRGAPTTVDTEWGSRLYDEGGNGLFDRIGSLSGLLLKGSGKTHPSASWRVPQLRLDDPRGQRGADPFGGRCQRSQGHKLHRTSRESFHERCELACVGVAFEHCGVAEGLCTLRLRSHLCRRWGPSHSDLLSIGRGVDYSVGCAQTCDFGPEGGAML